LKFLADMGVSGLVVRTLNARGHDAVHLRDIGLQRLPDPQILVKARTENRIVLTYDLDFSELMSLGGHSLPSVITFRMRDQRPSTAVDRLIILLERESVQLQVGAIATISDNRYRIRPLPVK